MDKLELSLTKAEINALLNASPFGLINWGRVLKSEKDALLFSVHTEAFEIAGFSDIEISIFEPSRSRDFEI